MKLSFGMKEQKAEAVEISFTSHSFSKTILCRKRCHHCERNIRFFGLRCRICRMKCHKSCSDLTGRNCFPAPEPKSKATFFRRPFGERKFRKFKLDGGLKTKLGTTATSNEATLRWKLGQKRKDACTGQFRSPNGPMRNVQSPTRLPTYSAYNEPLGASLEEFYGLGEENYQNNWLLSPSNHSRSMPGSHRGLTRLLSGASSGYSSVNQSCSSSAGTGSQRSRSPTPDHFEAVQEEPYSEKLGGRSLGYEVSSDCCSRRFLDDDASDDNVPGRNGVERNTTSLNNETQVFFLSDDESSGDWEERENIERFKRRPGLKRSLRELEIRYSDLEIDAKVGVGPKGPVYRGRWHGDVMVYTRKVSERKGLEEFRKEVALLSMIRHENVMLFMGACLEPPNLAVVTSLRKCLSIHHHLHCQDSRLSVATRLNVMLQVAQGMSYLHAKGITVPCLRTMNIYLESKVKLCINEYTYLHHQVKRDGYCSVPQGHLTYLAPEVISKVNVDLSSGRIVDPTVRTRKMDVFAYGTVMYEILTDKWPYANLCPETVIWMIGKGLPQSLAKVKGPDAVKDLIKSCWFLDPAQRPSFVDIISVLKQKNLHTNYIARRHSISEPEKMHCIGKKSDICHVQRI